MKWLWNKKYALIGLYCAATFVLIYLLKLIIDGAAYFLKIIPAFVNGVGSFFGWLFALFMPFVVALIIAYLFDPVVSFFQKFYDNWAAPKLARLRPGWLKAKQHKSSQYKSRTAGTAITYLIVILLIGLLIMWLALKFQIQGDYMDSFTDAIDRWRLQLSETYASLQVRLQEMGILDATEQYLSQFISGVGNFLQNLSTGLVTHISSAGGSVVSVVMGIIMAFYILSSKERMLHGFNEFVSLYMPLRWRIRIGSIWDDVHHIFSGYIRGQLTDAAIMAVLISVLLSVLRVDLAALIGIFTGLSNLIPYFGALIGFVLAVGMALLSGHPYTAIYAAIGVLILQQIDGMYINPKVVGTRVELSPMVVILALSVAGSLFGIVGMILAVPVCAIFKLFFVRYLERRRVQLRVKEIIKQIQGSGETMQQGQEKFLAYILERVQDDKKDEARALLEEGFAKQSDGSFNAQYLTQFATKIAAMLKPEFVNEVKEVVAKFSAGIKGVDAPSKISSIAGSLGLNKDGVGGVANALDSLFGDKEKLDEK